MENVQRDFSQIRWNKNAFRVIERTQSSLYIVVENLSLREAPPRIVKLKFDNPTSEWAMLWNAQTKEWKQHPDSTNPIDGVIIEAFSKPVGSKIKYSFGGSHELGSSRWGFTAERCHVENET